MRDQHPGPEVEAVNSNRSQTATFGHFLRSVRCIAIVTAAAVLLLILSTSTASALPPVPAGAPYPRGDYPWLVVPCRPENMKVGPASTSYYKRMFTSAGAGTGNVYDYWKDVSLGQLSIAGTTVAHPLFVPDTGGWFVEPMTEDQVGELSRQSQVELCADQAGEDYDLNNYYGVIALYPAVDTTLTAAISRTQTSIPIAVSPSHPRPTAATANSFPAPPFGMLIDSGQTGETVTVTAVHGHTLDVRRAQSLFTSSTGAFIDNSPLAFPNGAEIQTLNNTSYGAAAIGQASVPFGPGAFARTFNLALVNLPSNVNLSGTAHEMGHGFGLEHSRLLSTSTQPYANLYDNMSIFDADANTPTGGSNDVAYGGPNLLNSLPASKGPGLDAIQLTDLGLIPSSKEIVFGTPTGQATFLLHSLTDPRALSDSVGFPHHDPSPLEAFIHAPVSIPFVAATPATATSPAVPEQFADTDYYTLEYRESLGPWDSGIPSEKSFWAPHDASLTDEFNESNFPDGSVVLDLHLEDNGYGYDLLVDKEPDGRGSGPGVTHNKNLYASEANSDAPGTFWPGDEYRDAAAGFYFAVNSMPRYPRQAIVTVARTPIVADLRIIGPSSANLDSSATLSAELRTAPLNSSIFGSGLYTSRAVVPGHLITFRLGSQTCSGETGLNGRANCSLVPHSTGSTRMVVTAASSRAYASSSASSSVAVFPPLPHPPPKRRLPQVQIHRPAPPPKPVARGT